jgi:hypothetical protein
VCHSPKTARTVASSAGDSRRTPAAYEAAGVSVMDGAGVEDRGGRQRSDSSSAAACAPAERDQPRYDHVAERDHAVEPYRKSHPMAAGCSQTGAFHMAECD